MHVIENILLSIGLSHAYIFASKLQKSMLHRLEHQFVSKENDFLASNLTIALCNVQTNSYHVPLHSMLMPTLPKNPDLEFDIGNEERIKI